MQYSFMLRVSLTPLFCSLLFLQNLIGQSHLRYEKLTSEDGLSSQSANYFFQDSYGFIWICTWNGLNRYDGYEVKQYLPVLHDTTTISGSVTTSVYEDKDRNLWVGTWSNGLNLFDRKTETFRRFIHDPGDSTSISSNSILGFQLMLEDSLGNFWVGTDNGINLLDRTNYRFGRIPIGTELSGEIPTTGHLRQRADARAANRIRGMHIDRQGNFWVGTDWGGLYRYDYDSRKFVGFFPDPDNPGSPDHTTPGCFLDDGQGNLWILNFWNGLNKLDLTSMRFQRFPNDPSDPGSLSANRPLHGFAYDGRLFWLASASGLCTFDPVQQKTQFVEPDNSDLSSFINAIMKDRQGNLWIGATSGVLIVYKNSGGVQKLVHNPSNPKSISQNTGIIGVDSKGVVYVGHETGIDVLDAHKQRIRTLMPDPGVHTFREVNSFVEDKSGNLFFAGPYVYMLSDGKQSLASAFYAHAMPTFGYTADMYADTDNQIWFAGNALSVYNPSTKAFDTYYPGGEGNFASNTTFTVLALAPDQLLLGGVWDGLILFDTKERKFTERYPIGEQKNQQQGTTVQVTKIFRSRDQKIWLASNYGLTLFNPEDGSFQHYGVQDGLPTNVVYNILEDDRQRLWMSTANGISMFDPQRATFRNYDHRDGMLGNDFYVVHASFRHPLTGELWFSGPKGITIFHPDSLKDNAYAPPVLLTRVTHINPNEGLPVTDRAVYTKDHLSFSYYDCIIEFEFAALNFMVPGKNTYAYRLDGFNEDWVYNGTKRDVTFTNLRPGSYVLRVKAANNDGHWNEEELSVGITIRPPWYRTWLAYFLYLLTFLSLSYAIHRYQKQRTIKQERERAQERELKQAKEIEKAYRELESTHQELAATHENLKATQAQLIQREKMASLGEMTAGIAHEIQNPLNFVNNFSEINKELIAEMQEGLEIGNLDEVKSISDDIAGNEDKINFHGKRADAIVKSMLQHSRGSTGQKELTDINVLADEYLRLAYHGLRAKDKSFNADFLAELDPDLPKITVIPQDIGRVLLNLINNAFYACTHPANGERRKANGEDYKPIVTVSTKYLGNKVEIRVSDNGNGIPEAIKDKIFQPFFTTKPTGQGTGLGLSLSYDIVKAHGGEMSVTSSEGTGTEFRIELPIR